MISGINRFTLIGAILGFVITRFYPDGNLFITNTFALAGALLARIIYHIIY